ILRLWDTQAGADRFSRSLLYRFILLAAHPAAASELYTLSLHDALPIFTAKSDDVAGRSKIYEAIVKGEADFDPGVPEKSASPLTDRKSTRLNSSHSQISYAVFCLKKNTAAAEAVVDAERFICLSRAAGE